MDSMLDPYSFIIMIFLLISFVVVAIFKGKSKDLIDLKNPEEIRKQIAQIIKDRKNELEKKPAIDIISNLDNSEDVESIKRNSDRIFDRVLDRLRSFRTSRSTKNRKE